MILLFAIVVSPARCLGDADAAEQAARLMEDVVKHRMKISRGIVKSTVKLSREDRPERSGVYTWYLDGSKMRADIDNSVPRFWSTGEVADVKSTAKYVFTPEKVLSYDDVKSPSGGGVMAHSADLRDPIGQRSVKGVLPYRVDIRSLGMIPREHGLLYLTEPGQFLLDDKRANVNITYEKASGNEIANISFERGTVRVKLAIDVRKGPSLVSASTEWGRENETLIDAIKVDIQQHRDIWYPESLEYERTAVGRRVIYSKVAIESAAFNEDVKIEPSVFQFSGLGLPAGRLVREIPPPPGPTRSWNGTQLVANSPGIDRSPLQVPESVGRRFWWIGLNLVVVGVLILLAALKRYSR
ncbi:MAG: hypothetical protein WD851_03205 [Pirellulales bacterium]